MLECTHQNRNTAIESDSGNKMLQKVTESKNMYGEVLPVEGSCYQTVRDAFVSHQAVNMPFNAVKVGHFNMGVYRD